MAAVFCPALLRVAAFFLPFFILVLPATSQALVINHDTVWQGRIEVKDDVVVVPGAVLTLMPGTEVVVLPAEGTSIDPEFLSPLNEIMIRGRLEALGTKSAPITIHSSPGTADEWAGIVLDVGARVTLKHATLGGARDAVMVVNGTFVAEDSTFTGNRYGVVGFGKTAVVHLSRCLVSGNDYGVMRFSGAMIDTGDSRIKGNDKNDEFTIITPKVVVDRGDLREASPAAGVTRRMYSDEVLTGDTLWQGMIRVEGVVRVPDNGRLVILPGTVVEFVKKDSNNDGIGESGLQVQGVLFAKGNPAHPIVFRSAEKVKKAGDWDAINILGSDRTRNLIEYCRIENAYRGIHLHYANVGIKHSLFRDNFRGAQFQESMVSFSHVDFSENLSAIQARDSDVEFIDNRIFANVNGANFFRLNFVARGNTFANNLINGLRLREGSSLVTGNRISGNRYGLSVSDVYSGNFSANVISNNLEAGVLCRRTDNIEVSGNIIGNNGIDGLRIIDSRALITANLINANGERGLRIEGFSGAINHNNIVSNRKYQIGVDGPAGVDAKNNWWGKSDLDREIFDGHDKKGIGLVDLSGAASAPAEVTWPLSQVTGDVSWDGMIKIKADPGTVTVVKGARLNIAPGTTVAFAKGAGLKIYGDIVAKGIAGERISFTSLKEKQARSWGEISIERSLGSSFENCDFEYGSWGLHCHFVPIRISGCRFRNNDGGIRFRSGPMEIRGNLFRNNRIGIRGFHPAASIFDNEFNANEIAVFVREGGHGIAIHKNNFRGSRRYDILLGDFNTEDVAAQENWWEAAPLLFDANREAGIGTVMIEPRLKRPSEVRPWQ